MLNNISYKAILWHLKIFYESVFLLVTRDSVTIGEVRYEHKQIRLNDININTCIEPSTQTDQNKDHVIKPHKINRVRTRKLATTKKVGLLKQTKFCIWIIP